MPVSRGFSLGRVAAVLAVAAVVLSARPSLQGPPAGYLIVSPEGRRVIAYKVSGRTEVLPIDPLVEMFGLTVREDSAAGGLTITSRGERIVLTPGQPLASVGGRLVSLSGPIVRDGRSWAVPVDFVSRALGPALGIRIELRRASRLIAVGDVRVPLVTLRLERQGGNAHLVVETQPATGHRVARDGDRITIRFEADALDVNPPASTLPDLVKAFHVDDASLVLDLGDKAASFHTADEQGGRFTVDVLTSGTPPPAPARPSTQQPAAPPPLELPQGGVRTIVIDPGHGGADTGVRGAGGLIEKDLALQMARRLKATIESRIGLRVVLTREGDEDVPADRRTALANNNQADLLLSLHANASFRPDAKGVQVLSLSLEDYRDRESVLGAGGLAVPVAGGGMRVIEVVPWEVAQIRFASRSASLAGIVARHLAEQSVVLFSRQVDQAPLRILASANMPAVLIEMGFLSNPDDERALGGDELTTAIINALVAAIGEVRSGIPLAPGDRDRQ